MKDLFILIYRNILSTKHIIKFLLISMQYYNMQNYC